MVAGAMAVTAFAGTANAVTTFDAALLDPPGVYYGTGNPNSGFTVDTENGIELGLGTQMRFGAAVAPSPITGNIYYVPAGYYPSTTDALWNFRYSVNLQTSGSTLSTITPTITISDLFNAPVSFNPLAFGPATYLNVGFQDSQNIGFSGGYYNPLLNDTYTITLSVLDANNNSLGSVTEVINATPLPSTWLMLLSGFVGLGFFAYRGSKKNAAALAAA